MKGDDQKCLSAGCDDYLSKPIDRKKLLEKIGKYLASNNEDLSGKIDSVRSQVDELGQLCSDEIPSDEPVKKRNNEEVIDWESVVNICPDEDVIKTVAKAMLEDSPQTVKSIAEAIKAENPADVQLYAHKLRGAAATIGARRLSEKARCLERAGEEKDMTAAVSLFEDVQSEFEKLKLFLSEADWIETAKQQSKSKEQINKGA